MGNIMNALGPRIRDARERAHLTQQALGRLCGVSRAAIAQWENGTTSPSLAHLQRAADALGVWVSWLTGENEGAGAAVPGEVSGSAPGPRGRGVAVIDYVAAGAWDAVTDPYPPGRGMELLVTERSAGGSSFALVVRGTSMEPEFRDGDKIIVDPDVTPQPGDYVVAKLEREDEATFKKFRPRGSDAAGQPVIDLVPLNEDWPVLHIDAANPGRIVGTMVEHRRYRRR
jgi:SOS-response transcriptional repressor LexA